MDEYDECDVKQPDDMDEDEPTIDDDEEDVDEPISDVVVEYGDDEDDDVVDDDEAECDDEVCVPDGDEPCKFDDYTLVNNCESTNMVDVWQISTDFTRNDLLTKAKPGTWLYNKILHSTPMLASSILTSHLNVLSVHGVYLAPGNVTASTFYYKKK
ncbi:hypothetical protein OrNV_gp138 [Oryctes rhinoceros nudivirus]|uniref:Uncharacterized protein n=1 Tax=Oryctes rhinoceros nudivirus TaxID=92521 RepID=A3QU16_9VIRU|nr:hypothetical protein OrNV_gp138 [Oryctes rhinoceros nudivirus]ABF93352.1 unknown [Oryctes rhinoceros nudivirus]ACH96268.1 unknown [Oryctes rhinoceros nudivirus]QHG11368.1 hypothetical protein SI_OrNV_gp138 [Oryctes rhinoceros nudivirus]QKE59596.1 hypothetical protein SI_OrNV_gp138 [Oryctes rhinoceros nudivirus]UBO76543.1 hypothetical protein SI_OrNV_gp138 [Oryctes rhinoceros nudivirus]